MERQLPIIRFLDEVSTLNLMRSWQPEKKVKAGQYAYAGAGLLALFPVFVIVTQYSSGGNYSTWAILLLVTMIAVTGQFHLRFKRTQLPMRNMFYQPMPTELTDEAYELRHRSYLTDSVVLGLLMSIIVSVGDWILSGAESGQHLGRAAAIFVALLVAGTIGSYFAGLLIGEGMVIERQGEKEQDRQQKWALRAHASQMEDAMVAQQEREARLAAREAAIARRERELAEKESATDTEDSL